MKQLSEDQKRRIEAIANEADQKTDSVLAKVAKSKWSWAIAVGIIAAAWLFGYIQ